MGNRRFKMHQTKLKVEHLTGRAPLAQDPGLDRPMVSSCIGL